jgi:hypothetical protein
MGCLNKARIVFIILLLVAMPAMAPAQPEQALAGPPAIGQQMVREGDLALKLQSALGVGTAEDEAEAESLLAEAGVVPRNGWIADYPVTPEIMGELYQSVSDSVDAKKLPLGKEDALKRLTDVNNALGLGVKPSTAGKPGEAKSAGAGNYPNPTVINNYYNTEGPPVVSYYAPPPDYYYLYAWVPYPFWCSGFWFPGFFVLNDFHRTIIVDNRVRFISNHFNDVRGHRVFRIDPVTRFNGRTFAGIGVTRSNAFISTGVPRSERRIFNGPRTRVPPGSRVVAPTSRGGAGANVPPRSNRMSTPGARTGPASRSGERAITGPSGGTRERELRR